MLYTDLNLHPDILRGVQDAGYVDCMPVQESVFPHAFSGGDIYAQSQTGTGKTAAFLISIFQRIMTVSELRTKKVLILAPTRELAVQIESEAAKLAKHLPITMGAFYGGVGYGTQMDLLRSNVQMIIGTPGRIIDLLNQGKMLFKDVGFLVIDEADRMFDMGFIDDLRRLLRYLPPARERQTYLFSATLGMRVKDLAWEYMVNPKEIVIEAEHVTVDLVTQELYHVGNHEKFRLLLGIMKRENPKSALIFCNQKFMVEDVAKRLRINGIECDFIMGDLPQQKRLEIIERLKSGALEILVATDVAARGLDIAALDLVVNYDLPEDPESYIHRIGRTARAGKAGKAVSLACEKFVYGLYFIEKFIGAKIPTPLFDQALLVEDLSAHVHFRRDHDTSRGSHEGRDRGARRTEARRGPPHSRSEPRREHRPAGGEARPGSIEARPAQGERRPAPERPAAAQQPRGPAPRRREPARTPETEGSGGSGNPYAVSQDERMRQYKERYGERRNEAPRSSGGQGRQQGQGGRGGRGPGQAARPAQGRPAQTNPAPRAAQTGNPAQKGGILARIKGLFGSKAKKA